MFSVREETNAVGGGSEIELSCKDVKIDALTGAEKDKVSEDATDTDVDVLQAMTHEDHIDTVEASPAHKADNLARHLVARQEEMRLLDEESKIALLFHRGVVEPQMPKGVEHEDVYKGEKMGPKW